MKDAIAEHKDIPEGTGAHGGPTSEQRKDMMKKKAETPLYIGYNPPAILHVSLHGRGRVCKKQSSAQKKGRKGMLLWVCFSQPESILVGNKSAIFFPNRACFAHNGN